MKRPTATPTYLLTSDVRAVVGLVKAEYPKCLWCLKKRKSSNWEQRTTRDDWQRLCEVCWRNRERNPWNAVLPLRRNPLTEES
ncbi:hypothetical protein NIIDNTM18_42670 [Mycolicibacterium litorale]|uniref:Uncharacterized protein n=1 Tax=Mycolicibacterium litorale TaxID=758802 RepID=A0A6S6P997_9MYCO|nr:hypothetical protein NIIDNTM18_42670 [Mycolicibacterium litorale]